VALDESRELADRLYAQVESKKERQMRAYRLASDEELFKVHRVTVEYSQFDAPGHTRYRIVCEECLEGINDGREVLAEDGRRLCKPCASGSYYREV
jgi:formylmethanofuran dehydrogenase subunit E